MLEVELLYLPSVVGAIDKVGLLTSVWGGGEWCVCGCGCVGGLLLLFSVYANYLFT